MADKDENVSPDDQDKEENEQVEENKVVDDKPNENADENLKDDGDNTDPQKDDKSQEKQNDPSNDDKPEEQPNDDVKPKVDVEPKDDVKPNDDAKPEEQPKDDVQPKEKEVKPKDDVKDNAEEKEVEPAADWELYYWQGLGGRAMPVRLCLELGEVRWTEKLKGSKDPSKDSKDVKGAKFGTLTFPIIKHTDKDKEKEEIISQTLAICMYVTEKTGYGLTDSLDRIRALQTMLNVWDISDEWYAKLNKLIGFDGWITTRVGGFLGCIEHQLKKNNEGKGWFFGDKPSAVDVICFDFMRRYRYVKPEHYKKCPFSVLKEHTKRFEEIAQIKKYLSSERYKGLFNPKQKKFSTI